MSTDRPPAESFAERLQQASSHGALAQLRVWCIEGLIRYIRPLFEPAYRKPTTTQAIALSFLARAAATGSACVLYAQKRWQDGDILARVVLEQHITLAWICHDPKETALRVEKMRWEEAKALADRHERLAKHGPAENRANNEAKAKKHRADADTIAAELRKRFRVQKLAGMPKVKQMAETVGMLRAYETYYHHMSESVHSEALALAQVVQRMGDAYIFEPTPDRLPMNSLISLTYTGLVDVIRLVMDLVPELQPPDLDATLLRHLEQAAAVSLLEHQVIASGGSRAVPRPTTAQQAPEA